MCEYFVPRFTYKCAFLISNWMWPKRYVCLLNKTHYREGTETNMRPNKQQAYNLNCCVIVACRKVILCYRYWSRPTCDLLPNPWTCLSIYTFPLTLNSSIKSSFFVDVIPPKWWGNVPLLSSWLEIPAAPSGARTHSLCLCSGAAYECGNREAQIAQPFAS